MYISSVFLVYIVVQVFFLHITHLSDLLIDKCGVLKSPTIIMFLSITPFMSVVIPFMYSGVPMLHAYTLLYLCLGMIP